MKAMTFEEFHALLNSTRAWEVSASRMRDILYDSVFLQTPPCGWFAVTDNPANRGIYKYSPTHLKLKPVTRTSGGAMVNVAGFMRMSAFKDYCRRNPIPQEAPF